jgi:hypothetical protein
VTAFRGNIVDQDQLRRPLGPRFFPVSYYEEQLNQASCLNLVTNAVVLWNTVYMKAVLDQLKAEGHHVDDVDVAHLSPARYAHINPYGKYRFARPT